MKNLPKKIFPLLGASFFLLSTESKKEVKHNERFKEIYINAKLDTLVEKNSEKNSEGLKKFLENLNETQIFLLVTSLNKKDIHTNQEILLLLQTESRLSAEQSFIDQRHIAFLSGGIKVNKKHIPDITFFESVRPGFYPIISKALHSSKAYYVNNLSGYKSICPVFLDKNAAESFLLDSSKEALSLLNYLPLDKNQDLIKNVLNTKIITVGLGDFIEYYSTDKNNKFLEKVEFLFFPKIEENMEKSKLIKKSNIFSSKTHSFKNYQKKYFTLKEKR